MMVAYDAGSPGTTRHWLTAREMAVNRQCPSGARGQGLGLMSENGSQPTSLAFMRDCMTLGIHPACTRDRNPKGNADTDRVMRTLKEECLWWQEWTCPFELIRAVGRWITDSNEHYLHSGLGYKTPKQFELEYQHSQSSPFVAA